ncbi:MAG: TolC family protein [Acidobacteriota bacterium]
MNSTKARIVLVLVAGFLLSQSALGQGATTGNSQSPEREQRVGVDLTQRVRLTLRDAITMALENNRDIEIERLNVKLNEFDLRAANGTYDPALLASIYYDRRNTPTANLLASGAGGSTLTDNVFGNANLTQKLPWQGGNLQAVFDNNRSTTNNTFNGLNPQNLTTLTFTYTQPLWRNRTIDQPRRQIRIAKKRLDLSDSQFRQRAVEIIATAQRAYWELVFARRDRDIKRESVDRAQTQLEHNRRLVEAGMLAPADVTSAQVEVERRTDEAEAALEAIQRAENALKGLLLQPSNSDQWRASFEPVEVPQVEKAIEIPLADALKLAFKNRPETEQFRLRADLNRVDTDFYRNQAKPQIDFFASYGSVGLAGVKREGVNPITASSAVTFERLNQLSAVAGLPPLPPFASGEIPQRFIGSYGQSLTNLLGNDFRTFRVGVNINLALRNRTAEAQVGRALAEGQQIVTQRERMDQQIEVEVRNALQAVETARRRVEAAQGSRTYADLQYQSEQRKFDAGQSTNFLVLDRQNAFSAAQGRELKALTDYTKAVAELQRALSTTLASNSVELK